MKRRSFIREIVLLSAAPSLLLTRKAFAGAFKTPAMNVPFLNAARPAASGGGGGSLSITAMTKGETNATSTTASCTFAAGDCAVVFVYGFQGAVANHAVSDSVNGTTGWTKIASSDDISDGRMTAWYRKNMAAGTITITFTSGTSSLNTIGITHAVSNASTSAPFTGGEFGVTASGSTITNPVTPGLSNGTAASAYFAGLCNNDGTSNPATATVNSTGTTGGTWALASSTNSQELNAASYQVASVPSLIVSTTASRVHGWTTTSLGNQKAIILCVH